MFKYILDQISLYAILSLFCLSPIWYDKKLRFMNLSLKGQKRVLPLQLESFPFNGYVGSIGIFRAQVPWIILQNLRLLLQT